MSGGVIAFGKPSDGRAEVSRLAFTPELERVDDLLRVERGGRLFVTLELGENELEVELNVVTDDKFRTMNCVADEAETLRDRRTTC